MDPVTLNTIIGIIGGVIGLIGIVVGIIGWKSISTAIKIRNYFRDSTIQQAHIIQNGLDSYAVIKLATETAKEEIEQFKQETNKRISILQAETDSIPRIYLELKDGVLHINTNENPTK